MDTNDSHHFSKKLNRFIRGGFKWVIYAYFALIAAYIIFFVLLKEWTICKLEMLGTGFGISFSASLFEDLLVFLFLGVLGAIVPVAFQKLPNEESYHDRILALMNGDNVQQNPSLIKHLEAACADLLAFNRYFTIRIKILNYIPSTKVFKLQTELKHITTNMCNDIEFIPKDPNIIVYPDVAVDGNKGYVNYIGTFKPNEPDKFDEKLNGNHPIPDPHFKYKLGLKIPKNGELGWLTRFVIWSRFEKIEETTSWFSVFADRYTQNVSLIIENLLDEDVKLDYRVYLYKDDTRDPGTKDIILHSQKTELIDTNIELFPNDKFEIFLHI
ncbi:MAG TPA: hypothetical protein VIM55_10575 [Mucilaginibacter sp.]